MPKLLLPALLALLLAACAPVMETTYAFTPPPSAEGKRCAAHCETGRATCLRSCDRRESLCLGDADSRAIRDYNLEADMYGRGRRAGSSRTYFDYADRYRSLCATSGCRGSCDAEHRACYEECGGTVTATEACVANCGS